MSQKSRVEQQRELFTEFGFLVDPIRRLVFDDDNPKGKVPYVRAQFEKEVISFSKRAKDICQDGDYFYQVEWRDLIHAIDYFPRVFEELQDLEHQPRGRESVKKPFFTTFRLPSRS